MAVDGSIVDLHHHMDEVCERRHEALEARFAAQGQALTQAFTRAEDRFTAMDKALELAWKELGAWKEGSNEWRKAMDDLSNRFVTKEVFDKSEEKVAELRRWQSKMQGLALISTLLAVVAVILTIVQKFT